MPNKKFEQLAKKIIAKNFDQQLVKLKYLGGGSFGKVFSVQLRSQPTFVLKICTVEKMAKNEVQQLVALAKSTKAHYPEVLGFFAKDAEIEFDIFAMEKIEGKSLFSDFILLILPKSKREKIANDIIDSMIETHSVQNEKFGSIDNPSYTDWNDYYKKFAYDILTKSRDLHAENKLDNKILELLEQAWEHYDEIFSEKVQTASLIHGDLNVMNVMVNKKHELSGIIDPLGSMYADKEYDLFQLNNLTGKRFNLYKIYKQKAQTSKNCDVKCAFYALYNEIFCYIKSEILLKPILNPIMKEMRCQLEML